MSSGDRFFPQPASPMNVTLRAGAILLAVAMTGSLAWGVGKTTEVRVASSRELRVAIVDNTKASATRDALHQAFTASLGASLSRQCGSPVGVRGKCVSSDHAAFNLNAGVYDAVLVIGRAVPDALRRVESLTLSATPEVSTRDRALFLLIAPGDTSLQGLLATAFTGALSDETFIATFAGNAPSSAPVGDKVAASR
jgi:hypothetical protein